jgi:hypothetical protein
MAMRNGRTCEESRRVVYQEVCKSHGTIADFRAKLLALLPAASGASAFVLLAKTSDRGLLGPLGLLGFTAIFGLFMYELRGIEDCVTLRKRAEEIEEQLHIPPEESHFRRDRGKLGGLADEVGAGWIVYTAILLSWLYVAGAGFNVGKYIWLHWPWLLVPLYLADLGLALSPPWYIAARLAGVDPPRRLRAKDRVLVLRGGKRVPGRVESVAGECAKVKLPEGLIEKPVRAFEFRYGIRAGRHRFFEA